MRLTPLPITAAVALLAACAPYVTTTPGPEPVAGSPIRYAERADSAKLVPARLVLIDADSMVFERLVPGDYGGKWVAASLPTRQLARLQVRVGRRANTGRGALIGGAVGLALGVACTTDDSGFVPDEACLISSTATGAVTGFLIGALVRSDVWAPAPLPVRAPAAEPEPVVTMGLHGVGLRIPFRIAPP
ncbi:MAG TPA: hypothetical protein VFZ26_19215 [Gemmatimonadales bacterium]